jgi:hypothetical protein
MLYDLKQMSIAKYTSTTGFIGSLLYRTRICPRFNTRYPKCTPTN